ncbi:hypothetical protein IWQ52_005900 [Labrenzia sp. EL_159]|nr:hypothetical protein [Labrenzia sp. EL_162]MBG6165703.1 hypothetical protein [Labrenzia sp. EL_195]MBG6198344.1 hypothetical protein [Labrenzia sp. EL_159]
MRAGELKRPPLLPRNLAMRSCAEGHQVGFFDEISEQKTQVLQAIRGTANGDRRNANEPFQGSDG